MRADANGDVLDIFVGVDAVQEAGVANGLQRREIVPALVVADEQEVLAADGHGAQGAFGDVVVQGNERILKERGERFPLSVEIAQGLAERALRRRDRPSFVDPLRQRFNGRAAPYVTGERMDGGAELLAPRDVVLDAVELGNSVENPPGFFRRSLERLPEVASGVRPAADPGPPLGLDACVVARVSVHDEVSGRFADETPSRYRRRASR